MRFHASIALLPLASILALPLVLAACSKADDGRSPPIRETVTTRDFEVAGGLVRTHEETRTTEPAQTPERRLRTPQSGQITAADTDDLLNPAQYADYASHFLQEDGGDLPFVDPRGRISVKVVDARGKPVANARISIGRKQGGLELVSAADGIASFYPAFDGIGETARISVTADARRAGRTIQLDGKGASTVLVTLPGASQAVNALDLVLVLDTTGSMGDEMDYLKSELATIIARLKREAGNLDLRIGLILYRDQGDDYVTRSFPLAADIGAVRETLELQDAGGGGDTPEALDAALQAAGRMQWRPDAAKALLLVADAPPHREAFGATLDATQHLRSQGVRMVPVAASGVEDSAQYLMRAMAVLTQGRYIFLTDDSGIGNAHAEPDVQCYVVTRLDQLIARVLASMVEGRRIEAGPDEIVRTVGDYDAGRCRIEKGAANS
jgi:Mg-chelatase subunit ChlD